ncbi:hypothetical protein SCE1572_25915 [Sorangium cellulosum So0157-2]|uniref:Uncharacterized protein n=1 Tax=Sorangium cellulosum So0157-2 TaxID=1254432 RepID=S4XZ55_SORCE|nr:hypothetical protein SCE1572_25915 [Sorangium cellulosum So0157-2]
MAMLARDVFRRAIAGPLRRRATPLRRRDPRQRPRRSVRPLPTVTQAVIGGMALRGGTG